VEREEEGGSAMPTPQDSLIAMPGEAGMPSDEVTCPVCWEPHTWVDRHEIVAIARHGDQWVLIKTLSRLGVTWPVGYRQQDATQRAYGLLRMMEESRRVGLECSQVGETWVMTRAIHPLEGTAAA